MKKWIHFVSPILLIVVFAAVGYGQTVDIQLPGSVKGTTSNPVITVLSNGNFVYSNSYYSEVGKKNIGIVQLYNGKTLGLISTFKGKSTGDMIGDLVYALPNGNFVAVSYYCSGERGAATWINGISGLSGEVSPANSLMGTSYPDRVGGGGVTILSNGNYVVSSPQWSGSTGAVTWCSAATGRVGTISTGNSLVGQQSNDAVGKVTALPNGNYVVVSRMWSNGTKYYLGAVTLGNGNIGTFGTVNIANSLIGMSSGDFIGQGGITVLTNSNFIVCSPEWRNGSASPAGAATWVSGTTGLVGEVSAENSLVGSQSYDRVGDYVLALANGNYVVRSFSWRNGDKTGLGAVTWGNGATGTAGAVSPANSLVGVVESSFIGSGGIIALTNGNYVVCSGSWSSLTKSAVGAITWVDGTTGMIGEVNETNSLIGKNSDERLSKAVALTNGNYVVVSPAWKDDNGATLGAVVWVNGATGSVGQITAANAITGLKDGDAIGDAGVIALQNGNYVIASRSWDSQSLVDAGAVTWMNGTQPASGTVNAANSLYANETGKLIVLGSTTSLKNGNYVVRTNARKSGDPDPGTITWAKGNGETVGEINATNSLVGSTDNDKLGNTAIGLTNDGNYFIRNSQTYREGERVGSVTWGDGLAGTIGKVNDCNSVIGNVSGGGSAMSAGYNEVNKYLIVAKAAEDMLTIFYPGNGSFLAKGGDTGSAEMSGGLSTHFMNSGGCRVLASLTSTGSSPVTGMVNAKTWIEKVVPTFGGDPFVARHYEITPAQNAATATGKLTLYFSQEEFNAFNAAPGSTLDLPANANDASGKANLRIGKYAGTSSNGSGLPDSYASIISAIIDPVDDDIIWNETFQRWEVTFDTEGFSGFVVQTSTVPLPVRLVSFTGKVAENAVKLSWQIADAVNFNHFEVERSTDAKRFEYLGKVNFEEGKENYALTDLQPESGSDGQAYYRLKMVDLDGSYAFSKITSVRLDGSGAAYVYPNPVVGHFKISLPGYEGKTGRMRLINASGKVLYDDTFTVKNGELSRDLKKSRYEEGAYVIQLDFGDERRQFKITLVH